ncbi:MAG TPA: hypothetical protein VIY26_17555, partial [Acidimicrobiales bacterium]
ASTDSTLNEEDLSVPGNVGWPSPIVTYTVANPRSILRAESDDGAIVMAGDATGVNNLAGLGLLNTDSAIYYAGTLANHAGQLDQLASQGAQLVVTDTNRKQAFRWDTLTANAGYTETPDENPAKSDLSDSPVELFPGTGITSKTYASYVGAVNVSASSYGNSVSYTPEDQAYSAIDNNFDTAWITGTFVPNPAGQWWQAQLTTPVTTDHITVVQPQRGDRARWVSSVTLTFDGKDPIRYQLTPASHLTSGQTLTFPTHTFTTMRVTLNGTTDNTAPPLSASAVGFSEIEIPGVSVHQVIQMPTQMLTSLGAASQSNRLSVVMTRQRTSQYPPRSDPETTISRSFTLPTARTFSLAGSASMSALIPDDEIDRLVGRSTSGATGVRDAYSSGRLPGDLNATASATVDGNSSTAWQPGLGTPALIGSSLTYDLTKPQALSHLNLQVIADGRHSVPTALTITSGTQVRQVTLPPIADSPVPGATITVPLSFPAITGSHFIVTFTAIRPEYAANYYSAGPLALPMGIAEIGFPGGVTSAPTPAQLPGNCVSNLLTIDGQPIDVSIVGSTSSALDGGEVQVVPCGPDAAGIKLSAGTHVVESAVGHNPPCASTPTTCTGWNLDQLALDSAPGGTAGPAAAPTAPGTPSLPATQPGAAPTVTQTSSHIDTQTASVTGATQPFEFVLGQSNNKGWKAVATPGPGAAPGSRAVDLGTSQLVDSFANGWQVTAADLHELGGPNFTVTLSWTPQRLVWAALAISAVTLVLCLILGFLPVRSRRWLRSKLPRRLRGPGGPDAPERPSDPFDAPALTLPYSIPAIGTKRRGWARFPRALVLGALTGAVALLVAAPWAALVVAVLVAVGLVFPWARAAATIGGIAFIVAGCLNVVQGQRVHHYLPGSNWAGSFVHAGNLIWVGIVLLVADAAISSFGQRVAKPLGFRALRAVPAGAVAAAGAGAAMSTASLGDVADVTPEATSSSGWGAGAGTSLGFHVEVADVTPEAAPGTGSDLESAPEEASAGAPDVDANKSSDEGVDATTEDSSGPEGTDTAEERSSDDGADATAEAPPGEPDDQT